MVDGPGFPAPLAALLGVAAAVVIGLVIGLPALRIRGAHLAIVTLAAAGLWLFLAYELLVLRHGVYGDLATTWQYALGLWQG